MKIFVAFVSVSFYAVQVQVYNWMSEFVPLKPNNAEVSGVLLALIWKR